MKSIMDCLAWNIKTRRKKLGLTQSKLAKKARISLVFLQGIESGRKWISPTTAKSIALALSTTESRLFESCLESSTYVDANKNKIVTSRRAKIRKSNFEHIPDDIFEALLTTCKQSSWKWEGVRWIIKGYEHTNGPIKKFRD